MADGSVSAGAEAARRFVIFVAPYTDGTRRIGSGQAVARSRLGRAQWFLARCQAAKCLQDVNRGIGDKSARTNALAVAEAAVLVEMGETYQGHRRRQANHLLR